MTPGGHGILLTFKVAPKLFYLLWRIHALFYNAVYVFLTRKTVRNYSGVLYAWTTSRYLQPTVIITDFEQVVFDIRLYYEMIKSCNVCTNKTFG